MTRASQPPPRPARTSNPYRQDLAELLERLRAIVAEEQAPDRVDVVGQVIHHELERLGAPKVTSQDIYSRKDQAIQRIADSIRFVVRERLQLTR